MKTERRYEFEYSDLARMQEYKEQLIKWLESPESNKRINKVTGNYETLTKYQKQKQATLFNHEVTVIDAFIKENQTIGVYRELRK